MRSTKTNIAKKIEIGINLLMDNVLSSVYILDSFVMPNLFRHLCQLEKIPTCAGMTRVRRNDGFCL